MKLAPNYPKGMARLFWRTQLGTGIFSCLLYSCTADIRTRKTSDCVASHVFAWHIRQLHDSIPVLFRAEDSRQDSDPTLVPLFTYYSSESDSTASRLQIYFMAETADSAVFGKEYFTRATNKNIYLHCFGEVWHSVTYYAAGKSLRYRTDFAIKLDSIGPRQTNVTIETLHPRVLYGYAGIGGMCGLVLLPKEVVVPASKLEECALLAYLVTQLSTSPLQRNTDTGPEE